MGSYHTPSCCSYSHAGPKDHKLSTLNPRSLDCVLQITCNKTTRQAGEEAEFPHCHAQACPCRATGEAEPPLHSPGLGGHRRQLRPRQTAADTARDVPPCRKRGKAAVPSRAARELPLAGGRPPEGEVGP